MEGVEQHCTVPTFAQSSCHITVYTTEDPDLTIWNKTNQFVTVIITQQVKFLLNNLPFACRVCLPNGSVNLDYRTLLLLQWMSYSLNCLNWICFSSSSFARDGSGSVKNSDPVVFGFATLSLSTEDKVCAWKENEELNFWIALSPQVEFTTRFQSVITWSQRLTTDLSN